MSAKEREREQMSPEKNERQMSSEERPTELSPSEAAMEPHRVVLELSKQKNSHYVFVQAQSGGTKFAFSIDTGSDRSIIQKRFVPARLIRPTSVTEYAYVHHQVKIVGEASVPLTLGTGRASHEVLFSFLVTSESSGDILAMDFLTDFQCELTLDAEMSMSMSRQPQAPRQKYPSPYLALKVSSGKDKSFRSKFVVDTGARNTISLQRAESNGLKLGKPFSEHGHRCYKVSDKVVISSGDFSRQLIDPQSFSLGKICILGEKGLKRTVISLKDWTMTFKNNKGDITLPFL